MTLIPPAQLHAFADEVGKIAGMLHPAEMRAAAHLGNPLKKTLGAATPSTAKITNTFSPAAAVPAPPTMA